MVAGHAVLFAAVEGGGICDNADGKAGDDGDSHDWAEFVDEGVEFEEAGEVEDPSHDDCGVEAGDAVAVVAELFASFMWQWLSCAVDSW